MNISEIILLTRKQKGYTQESLAEATNLSLSTIQRIEKGKVTPRSHTLKILSDVLDVELYEGHEAVKTWPSATNELSISFLFSMILIFIPPVSILFLLRLLNGAHRDPGIEGVVIQKVLRFQIITFVLLLMSIVLIPLVTYLLIGQKTYGQLNLIPYFYIGYVIANITALSVIYRRTLSEALQQS